MDEEDDPVVSEHDVYVSTQLMPYLHILQLPGNFDELVGPTTSTAARFKPSHCLLDLALPLDTHHSTYSRGRGEELALASSAGKLRTHAMEPIRPGSYGERIDNLRLTGSRVPTGEHSRYFVAASVSGKRLAFAQLSVLIPCRSHSPDTRGIGHQHEAGLEVP